MLAALLSRISDTAAGLAPLGALGAPLAPVAPIQATLAHLASSNVHDTLFPFRRLGALHAARVTTGWAALTRGRGEVGVLQDLVGYLTVAWGGGTLAALLTSTTPAWLISPTPWLLYTAIYLLLVRTGLSAYVLATAPRLPFNLVMSAVDGLNRGMTITAMPALLARSPAPAPQTWWAAAVLGAIATNGGGWIAQTLGMHKQQWGLGRPGILDGGVLPTLDVWGALLVSGVYAALARTSDSGIVNRAGDVLAAMMPAELRDAGVAKARGQVVSAETARAVAVLVLGCLFAARAITVQIVQWRAEGRRVEKTEPAAVPVTNGSGVVKSPAEITPAPKPKPRKRKARKSKSPTP